MTFGFVSPFIVLVRGVCLKIKLVTIIILKIVYILIKTFFLDLTQHSFSKIIYSLKISLC